VCQWSDYGRLTISHADCTTPFDLIIKFHLKLYDVSRKAPAEPYLSRLEKLHKYVVQKKLCDPPHMFLSYPEMLNMLPKHAQDVNTLVEMAGMAWPSDAKKAAAKSMPTK